MFGSSGRIWVWVAFDTLICKFFGFGLFQVWVEKIVFKIQHFRAGSGRIFRSGLFLPSLIATHVQWVSPPWCLFIIALLITYQKNIATHVQNRAIACTTCLQFFRLSWFLSPCMAMFTASYCTSAMSHCFDWLKIYSSAVNDWSKPHKKKRARSGSLTSIENNQENELNYSRVQNCCHTIRKHAGTSLGS